MKAGYRINSCLILILAVFLFTGCQTNTAGVQISANTALIQEPPIQAQAQPTLNEQLSAQYNHAQPQQWGEKVSGVAFRLDTREKVLALTFDACGGSVRSDGYDAALIDYLNKRQIPATLFISGKWIDANPDLFLKLAANNLFDIGNHGLQHVPCSVNGNSAYDIKGTASVSGVIQEIDDNGQKIKLLTGRVPCYYRSGTNYYDEVAVNIVQNLGYQTVGYSVLGDAGATYSRAQVKKALLEARAGSIVIFHFNHPEGETAEGIMDAIPILEINGFKFVKLSTFPLIKYP